GSGRLRERAHITVVRAILIVGEFGDQHPIRQVCRWVGADADHSVDGRIERLSARDRTLGAILPTPTLGVLHCSSSLAASSPQCPPERLVTPRTAGCAGLWFLRR